MERDRESELNFELSSNFNSLSPVTPDKIAQKCDFILTEDRFLVPLKLPKINHHKGKNAQSAIFPYGGR